MTTTSSFSPSCTRTVLQDQAAHQIDRTTSTSGLWQSSPSQSSPPAGTVADDPIYRISAQITPTSLKVLERLADSNEAVAQLLGRQPDFQAAAIAAFRRALAEAFPHAEPPLNPDYVYVTTYTETEHPATETNPSRFECVATSSRTLTQALRAALDSGVSPTYNQSRTGFFYLPDNADNSNEVAALVGSDHLLAFERVLQQAVSASRPQVYQQALQEFWNTTTDPFDPAQTPKARLSAQYGQQRLWEAQLRVADGTLMTTSHHWLQAASGAGISNPASKPGVFALSLKDLNGEIPFSGIAVFTRSQREAPSETAGPVLLMIPGQGLMEFSSSSAYLDAMQQCFNAETTRTALLRHVARQERERERAGIFGNALEINPALRYRPIVEPVFSDRLQSQITQQTRDIAWAGAAEHQRNGMPGSLTDQAANLQAKFDISPILDARWQVLRQRQRLAHDHDITRFADMLSASMPLSPAAYADRMIRQRWGSNIDPRSTRLVTLHYDYAGHEAAPGQPKQGRVAHVMSLTDALLDNYQVVGDNRPGENAFGLYTPPRTGPAIEISNATGNLPAGLGHSTYEGIYRQPQSARYAAENQVTEITPAEFKQWAWQLRFKEKYRDYLRGVWPADTTVTETDANRRALLKTTFVKTAFIQRAENTLTAGGLKLALQAAGIDPRQQWEDVTRQQLQQGIIPANIAVAPLTVDGHAAVDIWSFRDRDSNRTLLYIPGNSSPLHEFDNPSALQSWIAAQAKDLVKREALLTHFTPADTEDHGHLFWKTTGVRSVLDGIAAYPQMRGIDRQQYAGAIYPHHRPGPDEVWDPARYVQLPEASPATEPFAQMALGVKKSMLAMVDTIRDNADVRWDNLDWYIRSTLRLVESPAALPLTLEFPMAFAFAGLIDAGYATSQALNGKTPEERKAGANRAAFGLFNALPVIAGVGAALEAGSVAAQAVSEFDNADNAIVHAAIPAPATATGDLAGNTGFALPELPPNRLRPALTGMLGAYAVAETAVAGIQADARGIYQAGEHWYIRYADSAGDNALYEIRSDFKYSDGYVQIIDPDTRLPVMTVGQAGNSNWQRLRAPGGMPRPGRLEQLQLTRETEARQMNELRQKWETARARVDQIINGEELQTHLLGISSSMKVKSNVRLELAAVINTDARTTPLDFSDFATNPGLLRDRIQGRIKELVTINQHYSSVMETFGAIKAADTDGFRKIIAIARDSDSVTELQQQISSVKSMLKVETTIISEVGTLQDTITSELERLLNKLDTLPNASVHKSPQTPAASGTGQTAASRVATSGPSTSGRPAAPRNRVEIRTVEDQLLNGKPRMDNPDIVDILDSRNQRKATYIRSPNEGYWIKYAPIQQATTEAQTTSVDVTTWNQLNNKFRKVLDEVKSAEKIVDFLARKGDGLPSTPAGILDHSANSLKETTSELETLHGKLVSDESRQQAASMIDALRSKAAELQKKSQGIRVTMILNNPPTAYDLEYLANRGLLSIHKTQSRIPIDRMVMLPAATRATKVRDYMDEFELRVSGRKWAYAHLHYPTADTVAENFSAAHLKRPEQRYIGAAAQSEAQAQGRRLLIHRGELYGPLVRKIFMPETSPASTSGTASA